MALVTSVSEGIVSVPRHCLQSCDVFVLAGGLGTRIRSVLGDTPKLLSPIGERTYLEYLLSWLRKFGARRVVFGLGHRAQEVVAYFRDHPVSDLTIDLVIETTQLGTAGAVRFARPKLHTDPVLVLNGDSFVDADLCKLIERQRATGGLGTILCAEVDNAERFGRVILDRHGYVDRFIEKDSHFHSPGIISAGVYAFSASLLDQISTGEAVSLEQDVFPGLPAGSLAAVSGAFRFIDIGTPESLANAAAVLEASSLEPRNRVAASYDY